MRTWKCRSGFTLIEAAACVGATAVMTGLGLVTLGDQPEGVRDAQKVKQDATQVRGVTQAMVVWAQNNKDRYPLPSDYDTNDATVPERGRTKDTTANIFSALVFNGSIPTEMLVSPLEVNPKVVLKDDYEFDRPKAAVKPAMALWDPSLKAALGPEEGHISYAHLQPAGDRLKRWSNTFKAHEAVITTRGPEISKVEFGADGATPTFANPQSNALKILGDGTTWRGHIAFNDCHVDSKAVELTSGKPFTSETIVYKTTGVEPEAVRPDVIFFDDADDVDHGNTYMGIFDRAGGRVDEWRGIWD